MNTKLTLATATALAALAASMDAATLAEWTFETSVPLTGGPFAAEGGINSTTSFASSNTGGTFSNPTGNGSVESFSSNGWDVGEYFQFTTGTTGYEDIIIAFSQTGSNTGPRDFKLQYSVNGTLFVDVSTYTVLFASPAWSSSSSTVNATTQYSMNLSAISAVDNLTTAYFRLVDISAVSVVGGAVAAAGSSRVDTVNISGTLTSVPEPGASLLGALGFLAILRRRR